jgi:hypothetical protein
MHYGLGECLYCKSNFEIDRVIIFHINKKYYITNINSMGEVCLMGDNDTIQWFIINKRYLHHSLEDYFLIREEARNVKIQEILDSI